MKQLIFGQDNRINKIFLPFLPAARREKGKKHHLFSKERHLRRNNIYEGLSICFYPVHSRAESAIAFSRLHPEAAKEIIQVNPACLAIAVALAKAG